MTTKRISSKPCPSNLQPALRSASKRRETVSTSPKAKRRQNGESAKEPSKNGSKADTIRAASTAKRSKPSSRKSSPRPSEGSFSLAFDKYELRDIARCARFDKQSPEAWAKSAVLGWIPETLEAIREPRMPARERAAKANKAQFLMELFHKGILRDELQLSPTLYAALNIVSAWESWTFGEMCRLTLISLLESEYGDMLMIIEGNHHSRREKAWAREHQASLAPLMKSLGWDGTKITREEEAA